MLKIIWRKKIHYELNTNLRFNNIIWGITYLTMSPVSIQPQSSMNNTYTLDNLLDEAQSQFPSGATLSYFCVYNGMDCSTPSNIMIHYYDSKYIAGRGEVYTVFLYNKGNTVTTVTSKFILVICMSLP